MKSLLRVVQAEDVHASVVEPVTKETLAVVAPIVEDVRRRGESALREHAERLRDVTPGAPLVTERDELLAVLSAIPDDTRALLERTAHRIRAFAMAQKESLRAMSIAVDGGTAGHDVAPLHAAGCYAPGGRFPLPSSVLMTACTAKVAGVERVIVASPRPTDVTLAAAAIAGADLFLNAGGAQAIAALAYGAGAIPRCDAVVGPGNRFVTAAKQLVAGRVAIDMLAGPSELVVLADASADAELIAADLLAQAEHDPEALPVVVTLDPALIARIEDALQRQLEDLPTQEIARAALQNGFIVVARDVDEAVALCDRLAPEHLELMVQDADTLRTRFAHYGALFVGAAAAEVLGDYGAGPNHVLPTGQTARSTGGLSVFTFLRVRTFLRIDALDGAQGLVEDAVALARLEGLEAHARAAERRRRR
jgi:phosphoribosyl-ATP pyrophosphohydrolase/phosphoribosyl-AMP cyclohydrolase/histidinol dehydrogenase